MFIDVTRYGGMRLLRVAVAAIAYLDEVEGGAAVHLVGGETLRVNEDPAQIEARVDATIALSPTAARATMTTPDEVRAQNRGGDRPAKPLGRTRA